MNHFHPFALAVHARYNELAKHELFKTIDGHQLSAAYLEAFPPGTNPIFRVNTEHDCSCCKNFIRNIGNLVAIIAGKPTSVWSDLGDLPEPYATVAAAMDKLVTEHPILQVFRTKESSFGAEQTLEKREGNEVHTWQHFHGKVARQHRTEDAGTLIGRYNAQYQVAMRGFKELRLSDIDTVLGLIDDGALYRGEEHKPALTAFRKLFLQYKECDFSARNYPSHEVFVWDNCTKPGAAIRNTVIGTLLQDLATDMSLEQAVKAFESKVAPTNYKRPKALVTPAMVKDAMKTITALGLEPSLERRFATMHDVSINDVLWADRSAKTSMKDGLEATLLGAVTKSHKAPKQPGAMHINQVLSELIKDATKVELMFENKLAKNLVSLTAPVHEDAPHLFKWDNGFGWSYKGNITDSIKERVKRAGGNVTNAALRVSLAWANYDDLDLHAETPTGQHIYFGYKQGVLDVDMNAGMGITREPVENMSWRQLSDGTYKIMVNQFSARETSNVGFDIEVEYAGQVHQFRYDPRLGNRETVDALRITVKGGEVTEVKTAHKQLIAGSASQKLWGIDTQTLVPVDAIMYSPNFWGDSEVGNRHVIFALRGCLNDEPTRGVYNEFLSSDLDKHRKVFELIGDKTKCPPATEQISGLGFSSTQNDAVTLVITTPTRVHNVNVTF